MTLRCNVKLCPTEIGSKGESSNCCCESVESVHPFTHLVSVFLRVAYGKEQAKVKIRIHVDNIVVENRPRAAQLHRGGEDVPRAARRRVLEAQQPGLRQHAHLREAAHRDAQRGPARLRPGIVQGGALQRALLPRDTGGGQPGSPRRTSLDAAANQQATASAGADDRI